MLKLQKVRLGMCEYGIGKAYRAAMHAVSLELDAERGKSPVAGAAR